MRAVVQRVASARVTVDGHEVGAIAHGLAVLVGIAVGDSAADGDWMLDKVLDLRIFENEVGKFDRSLRDVGGALLLVSQFTLLADTRKGRRPSFSRAAPPKDANPLYAYMLARAGSAGVPVAGGTFGARMQVALVNDGPVTILLDSRDH